MNMKVIAIFGGSFDPVHKEHKRLALEALADINPTELIVMPAGRAPHKKNVVALDGNERLKMLELAFKGVEGVRVSDYELKKEGYSYTYETLEKINERYKPDKIYFLVGTDMLLDFPAWRKPERILELATLYVTPRQGENREAAEEAFKKSFDKPVRWSPYEGKVVSGTEIRARVALGLDCSAFLDENVYAYIKEKKLYDVGELGEFVKKSLTKKRMEHTAAVMTLAVRYARAEKVNADKAFIAAMLHDCAKYLNEKDYGFSYEGVPQSVVHQFLGADVLEEVFHVEDEEILSAVRYHTTGRKGMSKLEKIVFLADLLEPNRSFNGVERLRAAVDSDFENGFRIAVEELYKYLEASGGEVYYLTKECRDYYAKVKE